VSTRDTQRVVKLGAHILHLRTLSIDFVAKFSWDVFVELFVDKVRHRRFNGLVDLGLDLTGVKNQYWEYVEQTLLTFLVEVLQHLGIQRLFQKFCQKNSGSHPPPCAALTFYLLLLVGLGRCQ